jgi:hypothetical protein
VKEGLEYFGKIQTETGTWNAYPFYHTFHALSRSKHSIAEKQLEKALPLIAKSQNRDGSWGRTENCTTTFLVLNALKNASII